MQDTHLTIDTYLTNLDINEWLGEIDEVCDDFGFFEQLGQSHFAGFLDAGNRLLVTFENIKTIRAHNPDAEPRGFNYARHDGWSHLCILSIGESWFRDEAIYEFFDRMIDEGFFEDFENIVFHGANGGGYAAAAYSAAAPECTVVALRPQATLDPAIAGWDKRYKSHRRLNFSDRYGYAPDMIEGASQVFIAYDNYQRLDAVHMALFRNANVIALPCPLHGDALDLAFDRLDIHDVIIKLAMDGDLNSKRFSQLLRARRYDETYGRLLVDKLMTTGHKKLARVVCDYMMQRGQSDYMARTARKLDRKMRG